MTSWATRSWSESVASVLSTQRRCAALSGSLGERGPVGVEIAGGPDEVAGAIAPHPVVAMMIASATHVERGVMSRIYDRIGSAPFRQQRFGVARDVGPAT